MEIFLTVLLVLLFLAGLAVLGKQRSRITALKTEREEIDAEEHRLFDFLHGLGLALQSDSTPRNMNRYIVEGVTKVVAAKGGALYLLDKTGRQLVPTFQSRSCPPLIDVPDKVLARIDQNPQALDSFLRLQSLPLDAGILGQTLKSRKTVNTANLSSFTEPAHAELRQMQQDVPVMVAPLVYAGKPLGVLAVAGRTKNRPFSTNDFDVFESVAEQSSFALGSALIHREAHEKKQLENEIRNASEIQKILLPSKAPELRNYTVSAMNYPAKIVSGDYYDYIRGDDQRLGVVIGDVSGKGIPASLIMAMCRSVIRVNAAINTSPHEVICRANRALFPDIREDMFISMAYLVLREDSDDVTLVRAGHDPPMLYRKKDASVELLKPPGLAVGIDDGDVFDRVTSELTFTMNTGDALLLYTDGVNEALNATGDEFGVNALLLALQTAAGIGAQGILDQIADSLRDFMGSTPQNDDITLIAIEKR